MSELARDFFAHNPAIAGPLLAMAMFAFVFVTAAIRAWRASHEHVNRMAQLALEGESEENDDE
ncbi:MAG: hypothetical protein KF729_29945 [Sandaracinaceae bacterium]|nr:hypothetical protein [Sandaracinaceae bacterium]